MSVSREELAAYADGELVPARALQVAAEVAADPELAEQVRRHKALRQRLAMHFEPILHETVPERLTRSVGPRSAEVTSLAFARAARARLRRPPRWSWVVGPALAASLALAIFLPRGADEDYAQGSLAAALGDQLVATQGARGETRILLSFRDSSGKYCRVFDASAQSGIACRDDAGWRIEFTAGSVGTQSGEYRAAATPSAQLFQRAQAMASGEPLNAQEEEAARARGWR
jgi:hypothetical protein